jgi:hypothetical protein
MTQLPPVVWGETPDTHLSCEVRALLRAVIAHDLVLSADYAGRITQVALNRGWSDLAVAAEQFVQEISRGTPSMPSIMAQLDRLMAAAAVPQVDTAQASRLSGLVSSTGG